MNRALISAFFVIGVTWMCPASRASLIVATATLSGAAEAPPVASPGTGFARVTFDLAAHTLRVEVTFSDLVGTTTAAHIHSPTASPGVGNVGVATYPGIFPGFPVGVTSGTYDGTWNLTDPDSYTGSFLLNNGLTTPAIAEAALIAYVEAGRSYLNIHTSFAPGGEIRGFLQVQSIPEPASVAIWGLLGAIGLTTAGRRRWAPRA